MFLFFDLYVLGLGVGKLMKLLLVVEAAMPGRSVNRAARMVRGLDPDVGFAGSRR